MKFIQQNIVCPLLETGHCDIPADFCACVYPGYRHVYLEGMEEASIFVHVAVNDITGKVGTTEKNVQ